MSGPRSAGQLQGTFQSRRALKIDDGTVAKSLKDRPLSGRKATMNDLNTADDTNAVRVTTNGIRATTSSPLSGSTLHGDVYSIRDPARSTSDTKVIRRSYVHTTSTDHTTLSRPSSRATPTTSQHPVIRKRNSGLYKSQNDLMTSESEHESSIQSHQIRDRAPPLSAADDSMLVSELEAVKARVLEMERENRSHLDLHQSQVITPQSLGNRTPEEHLSQSVSDKLRRSTQRHPASGASGEPSSSELLRSTISLGSSIHREKHTGTNGRSVPSSASTSPQVSAQQLTIQHLSHLQDAFWAYEKTMSALGDPDASSAVQDMSKVVSHAIRMNQIIRAWIKADVSGDSSAMITFQQISDEQIQSLTGSLLNMARMQSIVDRLPDTVLGGTAMDRSYLSTQSIGSQRIGHGQRDQSIRTGLDHNTSYSARSNVYEPTGSTTPNGMASSGPWVRASSAAPSNVSASIADVRSRPSLRRGYGSDYGRDQPQRHSVHGTSQLLHAGAGSSREPSPPKGYGNTIHSAPLQLPTDYSRTMSPSHGRGDVTTAQLARRQANVRDIVARYSRNGPRSPTFDRSHPEQDMTGISQSEFPHDVDRQPRRGLSQDATSNTRPQQRQYQSQYVTEDPMTASVEFSSNGRPRPVPSSRRPLSQQDHHSYTTSEAPHVRRGSIIQRSGRYAHDNVFSEDESIGGWEAWKLDRLPSRSNSGSFAIRVQQIPGRSRDQLQPLHQQVEQFRHMHVGEHFEEEEGPQQQLPSQRLHGGYSERVERDVFISEEAPKFTQRRPLPHHHPDMMMTTPAMPSPNSSPSSTSRVDVMSNGYQGLAAPSSTESRYNLSPRGSADTPTLRRQQSMNGIIETQYQSPQARRPIPLARGRGHP